MGGNKIFVVEKLNPFFFFLVSLEKLHQKQGESSVITQQRHRITITMMGIREGIEFSTWVGGLIYVRRQSKLTDRMQTYIGDCTERGINMTIRLCGSPRCIFLVK